MLNCPLKAMHRASLALLPLLLLLAGVRAIPSAPTKSGSTWVVYTIYQTGATSCSGPAAHINAVPAAGACLPDGAVGVWTIRTCNSTSYSEVHYNTSDCSSQPTGVDQIPIKSCSHSRVYGYWSVVCDANFSPATSLPAGSTVFASFSSNNGCGGDLAFIEALPPRVCFEGTQYWCTNTTEYEQTFKDTLCTQPQGKVITSPLGCQAGAKAYCNL